MSANAKTSPSNLPDLLRKITPLALIVLATVCVARWYVLSENGFYWSDFNWWDVGARFLKDEIAASPGRGLLTAWLSMSLKDSLLYAVPILPFALTLGSSRLVYITSLAVMYLVPYVVALAMLYKTCANSRRSILLPACIALCVPAVWVPTLRGLPDAGGAFMIVLCMLLYLRDPNLRKPKTIVLIGVLMALAPLFRRHYLFGDIALVWAMLPDLDFRAMNRSNRRMILIEHMIRVMFVSVVCLLVLLTFGFLFVNHLLLHNYASLNASYRVPIVDEIGYYVLMYGAGTWALAAAGWICSFTEHERDNRAFNLILSFSSFSMVFWIFLGRQVSAQYSAYFNVFIVVGIQLLVLGVIPKLPRVARTCCWLFVGLFVMANATVGLAPKKVARRFPFHSTRFAMVHGVEQQGDTVGAILSAGYPPYTRNDVPEVNRLVNTLRKSCGPSDLIVVAAASDVLNQDTLRNAERRLYGWTDQKLKFLDTPQVDSLDSYPLPDMLQATWVLTAKPVPVFLRRDEEHVLTVVDECFGSRWKFSKDFSSLPDTFTLDGGTVVTLHKREHPTAVSTAVETLSKIENYVGVKPGSQRPAINLTINAPIDGNRQPPGPNVIDGGDPSTADGALLVDRVSGSCEINATVEPAGNFIVQVFDEQGQLCGKQPMIKGSLDTTESGTRVTATLNAPKPSFLLVRSTAGRAKISGVNLTPAGK